MENDGITSMEKSGRILLTQDDLASFYSGLVSDRVRDMWGISFEELRDIIQNNQYEKV